MEGFKKILRPVFIDPVLKSTFEREIVRPITHPELYDDELVPVIRLHLLYGQPGSGMKDAIAVLLEKHKIPFHEMIMNDDQTFVLEQFNKIKRIETPCPVLVVCGVPRFYFRDFNHLKQLGNFLFIIVISNDIPEDDTPFYRQFKSRILMGTPGGEYFIQLMKYYFEKYNAWKGQRIVNLSEEDYEQIATRCCAYCLPKDMKSFARRAFRGVLDGEVKEITREYLDSLMFNPFSNDVDAPCIIDISRKGIQDKYEPTYHGRTQLMERKRPRGGGDQSDV